MQPSNLHCLKETNTLAETGYIVGGVILLIFLLFTDAILFYKKLIPVVKQMVEKGEESFVEFL